MSPIRCELETITKACFTKGLLLSDGKTNGARPIPISLNPSPLQRRHYDQMKTVQPFYNELVYRIVEERHWLDNLAVSTSDPFVRKLHCLWQGVRDQPHYAKKPNLICCRADYMLHQSDNDGEQTIKLVEFNTISVSFVHLGSKIAEMQRELHPTTQTIPENPISSEFCALLNVAVKETNLPSPMGIMVVQPHDSNVYDKMGVIEGVAFPLKMMTFAQIKDALDKGQIAINPPSSHEDGCLWTYNEGDKKYSIALFYFRAAYQEADYHGKEEYWQLHRKMEESKAILLPDVASHLTTMKKVQQELCRPGAVELFVSDPRKCQQLRETFTNLYPLDKEEHVKMVMAEPKLFVLKSQAEGGGRHIYGDAIPQALVKMTPDERSSYVLMDLINSPTHPSTLLRHGQLEEFMVIGEYSIYGGLLATPSQAPVIKLNRNLGYLVRTKPATTMDGGVCAGNAVLDALEIIPDK